MLPVYTPERGWSINRSIQTNLEPCSLVVVYFALPLSTTMKLKKLLRARGREYLCTYSIVASVVRDSVYGSTQVLCVASKHCHVKTESSQANEEFP